MRVQGGSRPAGGVQYALLSDHLGSVTAAVNRWNAVTGSMRYGAWGEERVSTDTMPTDRGYTGQLEAEEVGSEKTI